MSADFGLGYQKPGSSTNQFNTISFIIERALAKVRTVVPVQVLAVTNLDAQAQGPNPAAVGFVDVQPLVNQLDGLGNAQAHGRIFHLPYFRMQGGANAIVLDPQVNDIGFAVICDRDISSVKNSKARANPGSFRRFDLADGIYLGGILNVAPKQALVFNSAGVMVNSNVAGIAPQSILGKFPTVQLFTSSGTYMPSAGCVRSRVRMIAGGGGGGSQSSGGGNSGGNSLFGGWGTVGGGGGGGAGNGGGGGSGGSNGTGTIVSRFTGGAGGNGSNNSSFPTPGGMGGCGAFGGNGGGGAVSQNGTNGHEGGGGGGAGFNAGVSGTSGGGGGAGEYAEFLVNNPVSTSVTIGSGGTGGSGTFSGGTGGPGRVIVEEYYN